MKKLISIVIPLYNEEQHIPIIYAKLNEVITALDYSFEIIFINDGSSDNSISQLEKLAFDNASVRIIDFSRNFGKEAATSAGLMLCNGDACILLDADLQHPVELIPDFIAKWEQGAEVVVGVRKQAPGESLIRKAGSYLFYLTINSISETDITPHATDYRLLDRIVIDKFKCLTERNRMTRALIDWLGFRRDYIYFTAKERPYGRPSYTYLKLLKLAISSYIAHSLFPLKIAGYIGIMITVLSGLLGAYMLVDTFFIKEPWKLHFTGTAILVTTTLFLIGIVLSCLGLVALYIGNIHTEVINRPMYVIRKTVNL